MSSSCRFKCAMWLNSELVAQRPEVVGLKNLEKIPKGINPIIAGTHLRSDASLQIIARELSYKFDIGIAIQAGNRRSFPTNTLITLVGQSNFYDIENVTTVEKVDGECMKVNKYPFVPDNYEDMKSAMKKGKTILVSAHYAPIYSGVLPEKPGYAAIYLAHLSGQRVILPVTLNIYTDDEDMGRADRMSKIAKNLLSGKRPKSKMTICEPIILDPISPSSIKLITEGLVAKRDGEYSDLKPEEQERARGVFGKMRQKDGEKLMYALAAALPPERRGVWNKKPQRK